MQGLLQDMPDAKVCTKLHLRIDAWQLANAMCQYCEGASNNESASRLGNMYAYMYACENKSLVSVQFHKTTSSMYVSSMIQPCEDAKWPTAATVMSFHQQKRHSQTLK
jgi:hypothetical protein